MDAKGTAGLIPLPAETLTPHIAAEWLRDWAGEYVRVVYQGLEQAKSKDDRNAYAMLGVDVSHLVEACGEVLTTGKPVKLEPDEDVDHLRTLCANLARICATRPFGIAGAAYESLARRIVTLMGEEFAEGAIEAPRPVRPLRGCA